MGVFGLFGCGSKDADVTDEEWNRRLVEALEPLDHVEELTDFNYSMQGAFGGRDSAWVSGTVRSDTNDPATNEALLEEVGRQIATVHRDNGARRSSIMVHVLSPNLTKYKFETMLDVDLATLDTLAAHYGIARR
ncbi:hypothetical protein C3E87_05140 [Tessaracoccus sp. ZS01]|nr:hypothetical protein [Tessaracoccus sp. ZS01]OMG57424.1 hypothetical protein BJN44_05155 [Tessaracoccus sp. ZS01]